MRAAKLGSNYSVAWHTGHPFVGFFFFQFLEYRCKWLFNTISSHLSVHLHMPRLCLSHGRCLLYRRHSINFVDSLYEFSAFRDGLVAYFPKTLYTDFWFYHHLLESHLVQCDSDFALPLLFRFYLRFLSKLLEMAMSEPVTWFLYSSKKAKLSRKDSEAARPENYGIWNSVQPADTEQVLIIAQKYSP